MNPDGTVSWSDDLSRASWSSMEKVAEGQFSLKLFSAHPLDSGFYHCVVSVYAGRRNPGHSTPVTLTQRSEEVSVNLNTKGNPCCLSVRPMAVLVKMVCVLEKVSNQLRYLSH